MDEQTLKIIWALIEADYRETTVPLTLGRRRPCPSYPSILPYSRDLANELGGLLTHVELRSLIRGLIRYSREAGPSKSGGSASPVIPIYEVFVEKYPDEEPELTAWIVENRVNEYEPFGTIVHDNARNLEAYHQRRVSRQQIAKTNIEQDQARHQEKLKRVAIKATEDLPNAVKRGDIAAVEALLAKGADPKEATQTVGSLIELATHEGRDNMIEFLKARGIQ